MKVKQLGGSSLEISNVVLGTWALGGWMWGGTEGNDPTRAIHAALDAGINTVDTAPMYGFGLSEELVGKAIKGRRSEVIVATKFSLRWDLADGQRWFDTIDLEGKPRTVYRCNRKASIVEECENSLRRLGVDEIDLYQAHWPDDTTAEEETVEALMLLREQGKIREYGVSNFDTAMMCACARVAKPASLQPPYSLLARGIEEEILPFCREQNIGVICYSPMYRGLLTGKFTEEHVYGEGDARANDAWFHGEKLAAVNAALRDVVQPIADAHGANLAQVSVAWVLAQAGVTAAIVGARNEQQARANAAAGDIELTLDEVTAVTVAFEGL